MAKPVVGFRNAPPLPDGYRCIMSAIPRLTSSSTLPRRLQFPVLLGDLEIPEEFIHGEYDTISSGQFSTPAQGNKFQRPLRAFSFETMVLSGDAPWTFGDETDPDSFIKRLLEVGRSREPVSILVSRRGRPALVDNAYTIRSVSQRYPYGQPEAVYLSIQAREFREAKLQRAGASPVLTSRKPGTTLPTKHPIGLTDTLASLSRKFYGTYLFASTIAARNDIKNFGKETPLFLYPGFNLGDPLVIPAKVSSIKAS